MELDLDYGVAATATAECRCCRILNIALCSCHSLASIRFFLLSVMPNFLHFFTRCRSLHSYGMEFRAAPYRVFSLLIFYKQTSARQTKFILINMNYTWRASTIFVYKIIIKLKSTGAGAKIIIQRVKKKLNVKTAAGRDRWRQCCKHIRGESGWIPTRKFIHVFCLHFQLRN